MNGWIKIYREIEKHWIWDNPVYLKAWLAILLIVNHEDNKVLIENEVIECKRGQSLNSLKNWAKAFGKGWSIQKVRTFLNLLKIDSMINTEGLRKTTRLTVCNYDIYQNSQQTDNTQPTDRQHAANRQITTNKKEKNDKNDKKKTQPIKKSADQPDFIDQLLNVFGEEYKAKYGIEYETLTKAKERKAIRSLLTQFQKKNPGVDSKKTLVGMREGFKLCMNTQIKWVQENMSPTTLVSKYADIQKSLKNGKSGQNSKGGATDAEFVAVIVKNFATDR